MAIEPLKIVKNWLTGGKAREANWDEITDKVTEWATRVNNYLKQIGLDIDGASYSFNQDGRQTATTPVSDRLDTLEAQNLNVLGARNVGLDVSTVSKIKLVSADATSFSSTNAGVATFNSTTSGGVVIARNITANLEVTLTGAHWGLDTDGDLTDYLLWILLIDTGSSVILGVTNEGGKQTVAVADSDTAVGNITTSGKVLVSTALGGTYNCVYIGWIKADFDDTGNAGGENFWTIQTGVGDVNIGYVPTLIDAVEVRF